MSELIKKILEDTLLHTLEVGVQCPHNGSKDVPYCGLFPYMDAPHDPVLRCPYQLADVVTAKEGLFHGCSYTPRWYV